MMKTRNISDPNDLYSYLHINKDLVTGFSIMFSRFEYALKKTTGYCQNCRKAKPDWIKFAKDHDKFFVTDSNPELKRAVQYLLGNPPKVQIVKNGKLDWENRELNSKLSKDNKLLLEQLVCSLKGVRNNLFHGGKFESGSVDDPGRNAILLESCITVLREFLSLNQTIENAFLHEW